MLTYQIRVNKAPQLNHLIVKEEVINKCLSRFPNFKVGDVVRLKKPKRNPIKGTITSIETDATKCVWQSGLPLNITVYLSPDSRCTGSHIVKTNAKKLLLLGG